MATSSDSGETWVVESTLPNHTLWTSVAANPTGTMLVVAGQTSDGQGDSEIWAKHRATHAAKKAQQAVSAPKQESFVAYDVNGNAIGGSANPAPAAVAPVAK